MAKDISTAVSVLKKGGVVVFPTETSYGLAADATNDRAVEKVMEIKGREKWKTPALIAAEGSMVRKYVELTPRLDELSRDFWPGPLTLIGMEKKGSGLSPNVVREGTVAIRVSSHKTAKALSRKLGKPIVATSANTAGNPPCFSVESCRAQLATQLLQPEFYLDEGPLEPHEPSTIVADRDGELVVIREGELSVFHQKKAREHRAKKQFGQNFLTNKTAIAALVDCAQIREGERVLEIGPGMGAITQELLNAGAKVTAVEIDNDLIEVLEQRFAQQITLINKDVLKLSSDVLSALSPYKIVSSIPYNITSDILKTFLTSSYPPQRMCLVVQKEVAERVAEEPPKMSLLSVVCQMYAQCEKIATVKAGGFRPVPKVDSAILRLNLYAEGHPALDGLSVEDVIATASAGFRSKRKQLHKNLSSLPNVSSQMVQNALKSIDLDPKVRAENLTVEAWIKLHKIINI